ncbi:ADP-ribosyltransferase [Nocardia sp. NPDC006044]|uniref:ADP-ribosyltransferase n=1 Tax=Nocardia sp. NPDC006044 TaxID=3364306 RepID=UPI0036AD7357
MQTQKFISGAALAVAATALTAGVATAGPPAGVATHTTPAVHEVVPHPEHPLVPEPHEQRRESGPEAHRGATAHLTDPEKRSIKAYTTNGGYTELNNALREGNPNPEQQAEIARIEAGLTKLPAFHGTVYRGIMLPPDSTALADYAPGRIVTERAFTSTSTVKANAESFSDIPPAGATGAGPRVVFEITSRNGRELPPELSAYRNEKEVLFAPGTKFRVEDKVPGTGGTDWIVRMVEL